MGLFINIDVDVESQLRDYTVMPESCKVSVNHLVEKQLY